MLILFLYLCNILRARLLLVTEYFNNLVSLFWLVIRVLLPPLIDVNPLWAGFPLEKKGYSIQSRFCARGEKSPFYFINILWHVVIKPRITHIFQLRECPPKSITIYCILTSPHPLFIEERGIKFSSAFTKKSLSALCHVFTSVFIMATSCLL